jgi:DNA polymerase-1
VKPPEEFYQQIPAIWDFVYKMDIPLLTQKGYEADDIIGTIARRIDKETNNLEIIILTGDQDTLQLVNGSIKVAMPKMGVIKESLYDKSTVLGKFGLSPEQIIDYKALSGDSSDNIPGVKGIGEKTATALLREYRSIENIYKEIEQNEEYFLQKFGHSITKKLKDGKKMAQLSKALATIKTDLELDFQLSKAKIHDFNEEEVKKYLQQYNFKSLLKRLPKSARANGQQEKLF